MSRSFLNSGTLVVKMILRDICFNERKFSQPVKLSLSQTPIFGAASSMTDGPLEGAGPLGTLTAVFGGAILKVLKSSRRRQMLSLAGQTVYSHTVGLDREVGEAVVEVKVEEDR